jgi:hypothetical protein
MRQEQAVAVENDAEAAFTLAKNDVEAAPPGCLVRLAVVQRVASTTHETVLS